MPENPINPTPDPNQIQQAEAAYERYVQKLEEAKDVIQETSRETLENIKKEEVATEKLIQRQEKSAKMAENRNKRIVSDVQKGLSDVSTVLQKTALGAAIIAALAFVDAQKKLATLSGYTVELFSKTGGAGGKAFGDQFVNTFSPYPQFVTDNMRGEFLKAIMDLGVPIKGITGTNFKTLTDNLLVLGKAFNVSSDQMADTLFNFQDILGKSTVDAGNDISKLANTALSLQVAPARLLTLSNNLVSTFKLQKMSLKDITEVFVSYRRNANLGVEAATELTQKTVGALAGLQEGKIAGLLALTTGQGGQALGQSLVNFFKIGGRDVSSRLDLALKSFKALEDKFPAVMQNEFARTRLVMQTFGVQDFSTGVQLLQAVEGTSNTVGGTQDAVKKAADILAGTSGSIEMINSILQNLTGRLAALAIPFLTSGIRFFSSTVGFVKTALVGTEQQKQNWVDLQQRLNTMDQRAAILAKLNDAMVKNDTDTAATLKSQLAVLDMTEANMKTAAGAVQDSADLSQQTGGIFDTMSDHLKNIKATSAQTALYSKATAEASAGKIAIPLPTGGFTEITSPTALKAAAEAKMQGIKLEISLKDNVNSIFKVTKKISNMSNIQ